MSIGWIIFWVVYGISLVGAIIVLITEDGMEAILLSLIPFLNTFLCLVYLAILFCDYMENKKLNPTKKKTPQKSKQSPTEELQVSDDNLIEKVLRSSNISSSNIVYAIVNKLKSASKSKYYCASLIGSVKSLFLDAILDAYDVTPYELKLKPHVVASELQSTMIEISKALDIQIHWIKDMEAKEKQLDYIDYSARENKRLDIIRSMTDDFITMNKIENADNVKDYTDPYGGIFQ